MKRHLIKIFWIMESFHMKYWIFTTIAINSQLVTSYSTSDANNIHNAVFTGYKKDVLPAFPVNISSEYNMLTINSLDMKSQTLSTSGWFTVEWTDSRLTWTPATHGNIEYIYASQKTLWHPNMIVQNSVTDLTGLGNDDNQLRIKYDGTVRWEPPAVLSTSCDMDVTFFPYDSQTCDIEMTVWGFHSDVVNLTFLKPNINLQDYRENGEWELKSTSQKYSEIVEDGLAYSELVFRMTLERRTAYYIMSVIFPVIVTAVLTAVTFLLPVDSGEKVSYILTVLLSLAVLLTLFADNMPTTSKHTSVLVLFLTVNLCLASLAIIFTVLIILLYHKPNTYVAPKWLYKFGTFRSRHICRRNEVKDNLHAGDGNDNVKDKNSNTKNGTVSPPKESYMLSNKQLAESLDNVLFIVFTCVYVLVLTCFSFTLSFGG